MMEVVGGMCLLGVMKVFVVMCVLVLYGVVFGVVKCRDGVVF